jgi:tetratricopeptide (TPR) repeat protein
VNTLIIKPECAFIVETGLVHVLQQRILCAHEKQTKTDLMAAQRWLAACCLGIWLLSGCATPAPERSASGQSEPAQAIAGQDQASGGEVLREPTDEEVMYRVFAAEYLGAEGDLPGAVGEYLEAAIRSSDPDIAQRATQVAFAAQAWQEAAMAADRWAVLAPESVPAHESAALAMLMVGDYVGAEYQMMKILDLMDGSTESWLLISNLLFRSGSPEQADEVLEQLVAMRGTGDNAEALFARSQLAVRSKDMRRAFELARQAVELKPERIEFLTWAGRLALNLQLPETGLEYVRRAWRLDPQNHDLTLAYADLLSISGEEQQAREVMRDMQQSPDVMFTRIMFELSVKKRPAAEKLYQEFEQAVFEDSDEKLFYQARSAEALGQTQQAIELYGQVKTGDRALAATLRMAELKALNGDLAGARASLGKLRMQPDPIAVEESWLAESRILREVGQREEAFRVLEAALNNMPESIPILYSHALLAAELGWVDIAENDLRIVISAQPENAAALNALGYTLADQTERYEEAEALIRQAYILQPNEASIVDSMGWIAYRLGKMSEAIEFLQRAWDLENNPEIAAHLGEVLWLEGRKEEATEIWRKGRGLDSQNTVLVETLERLGVSL